LFARLYLVNSITTSPTMSAADSKCQPAPFISESISHQIFEKERAPAPPSSPRLYHLLPQTNLKEGVPTNPPNSPCGTPREFPTICKNDSDEKYWSSDSDEKYWSSDSDEKYCPSDPGNGEESESEFEPSESDYEDESDCEGVYDDEGVYDNDGFDDEPDFLRTIFTLEEYVVFPPFVPIPVFVPTAKDSSSKHHHVSKDYRPADTNPLVEAIEIGKSEIQKEMIHLEIPMLFRADRLVPKSLAHARMIQTGICAHYDSVDSDDAEYSDDSEDSYDSDDRRRVVHFGDFLP